MTKLFTPPTYQLRTILESALRTKVTVSTTVYRSGGVWHNVSNPGWGAPDIATQVDVDTDTPSGIKLYFYTPTVVSDAIAADLTANGGLTPADPTWTVGTLT